MNPQPTKTRRHFALACAIFLSLCFVSLMFYPKRDWNSSSRLLLTYALVQQGTVEISDFVSVNGVLLEHPQTRDMSRPREGHYFCDKAPGHSFLGVIPAWISIHLLGQPPHPVAAKAFTTWPTDRLVTFGTNGLLTAMTGVLVFATLRNLSVRESTAAACALAYGVSTIALPNAVIYYGHSSSAFFCMATGWLLFKEPLTSAKCCLAGLCAGCAVVCEYTLVVLPVAAILGLLRRAFRDSQSQRPWRRLAAFVVGGVIPAAFLCWYHQRVTGSAFLFPYQFEVLDIFDYHKSGVPLGSPGPHIVFELLFGSKRGICWYSPVLILAAPGLVAMVVRRQFFLFIICGTVFAGLLCLIAGFPSWHGGWSTGPRFLLPAIPLLFIPIGMWLEPIGGRNPGYLNGRAKSWIFGLLAICGTIVLICCTIVGPQIPQDVENPLFELVLPTMKLPPYANPMVAPEDWKETSFTNLGDYVLSICRYQAATHWPGFAVTLSFIALSALVPLLLARRIEKSKSL